jgi:hypothetical protein
MPPPPPYYLSRDPNTKSIDPIQATRSPISEPKIELRVNDIAAQSLDFILARKIFWKMER